MCYVITVHTTKDNSTKVLYVEGKVNATNIARWHKQQGHGVSMTYTHGHIIKIV